MIAFRQQLSRVCCKATAVVYLINSWMRISLIFTLGWLHYFSKCRKLWGMHRRFCTSCSLTHPVVREIVQDQSGAEWASRIDATSRVADLKRARESRLLTPAAGAGSVLEVLLTAAKCPKHTERPMAKGAEPVTSRRLLSVTAITHSTSWKVASSSMPTPWLGVTWLSCDSRTEKQQFAQSVSAGPFPIMAALQKHNGAKHQFVRGI